MRAQAIIFCRSREGAWIEIVRGLFGAAKAAVAPARERGLKLPGKKLYKRTQAGRSREGAWIEINILLYGNSVEGVAPARERGLKFIHVILPPSFNLSLPRGSVD